MTVRHVVTLHRRGEAILEIAEALGITEAQVFDALSCFFDRRDEILALIANVHHHRKAGQNDSSGRRGCHGLVEFSRYVRYVGALWASCHARNDRGQKFRKNF